MSTNANVTGNLAFVSGALPKRDLRLRGVTGRESISKLFEYDLIFTREDKTSLSSDDIAWLLSSPCAVALGRRTGDAIHGIISSVEFVDGEARGEPRYRARMVPTVWLLTQTRSNRIFQNMNVPKLVETVLSGYGLSKGKDFDILMSGSSPEREYIVQYKESDWDFLQRWLEHEGFYYWFEHGESIDKLIISNSNADATQIASPKTIKYRDGSNLGADVSTIWSLRQRQQRIPARVAVSDYNYRKPADDLFVKKEVDKHGFGSVFYYGEHFKDNDQGKAIAQVRAERFLAVHRTISGSSDCGRLRVGHTFELENHHNADLDKEYLLTDLRLSVGTDPANPTEEWRPFHVEFDALLHDVQYRPERVTPWPRIDGLMHAHVEADSNGDYAQIDDQGRYKVRLPFDGGDTKGAKASRWIRMAQHYSGSGYGSHFPLHKGAEVILGHIDGDPDRPIIVGSVPNPHTSTPSTSANATQSVISTHSGIKITMEDRQS